MTGTSSTEAPGWGVEGWDHARPVLCVEFGFILVYIMMEVNPVANCCPKNKVARKYTSTWRFSKLVIQGKLQDLFKILYSKYIDLMYSKYTDLLSSS